MIRRNFATGKFQELSPDGVVLRDFEQKVWVEIAPRGNIVALHRIDFSDVWHLHGKVPVMVASPNRVEDVTEEIGNIGLGDDQSIVALYRFNSLTRQFQII